MKLSLISCAMALACSAPSAPSDLDASADAGPAEIDAATEAATPPTCDPGQKKGVDGDTFAAAGVTVRVRTPTGYDPNVASPFLMVYSPCCGDAAQLETFTGLTPPAKSRGYLVAYADHIAGAPLGPIEDAATILGQVAARYCVDSKRVYVTGHSDGGSITEVIGALALAKVAAIAPSAAGFALSGAEQVGCPKLPLPVFEMHSKNDQVFPISQGYGADVARWWAQCDACDPTPSAPDENGCVRYESCTAGVEVRYCEGSAPHGTWPGLDDAMFDFFDRFRAP